MSVFLSRPTKLNHIYTVRYEIDMLRHTFRCLAEEKLTGRDAWVYLEAFLLHYRNLIEFFGDEKPSSTDVHVTTIWRLENLAEPPNLNEMYSAGKVLLAQYEPTGDRGDGRISQYVQHCTTKRTDPKDWEVSTMMNQIEPLLYKLESSLELTPGILPPVPRFIHMSTYFSASTTVNTITSAAAVNLEVPLKKRPTDFE